MSASMIALLAGLLAIGENNVAAALSVLAGVLITNDMLQDMRKKKEE
ncbi:hypothetical protein [Timonella sp. A28]